MRCMVCNKIVCPYFDKIYECDDTMRRVCYATQIIDGKIDCDLDSDCYFPICTKHWEQMKKYKKNPKAWFIHKKVKLIAFTEGL